MIGGGGLAWRDGKGLDRRNQTTTEDEDTRRGTMLIAGIFLRDIFAYTYMSLIFILHRHFFTYQALAFVNEHMCIWTDGHR